MDKELLKSSAVELGVELDDMALDRFELLDERMMRWNAHVNLTAIKEPEEIIYKHYIDSLTFYKVVNLQEDAKVIDVGCGAGFPSLPILIARPDLDVTFLDSIGKRLGFIKEYLKYAGLPGEIIKERAEVLGNKDNYREIYDVAVSRAVASLNILAEYCLPFVRVGGYFIAFKGSEDETASAKEAITTLGGKIEDNVELTLPNGDKRMLVVIKKVSSTPGKYPRRSKKIDTKPL